ncbi:hypothetical protein M408DRAFT_16895 [Serendipita vermifera MAFF 305830]|uniref:Uncharacterized protein n=1 Tax=Serendipita vermifera MAFF 305830 TaxID=933852 RepID=A0A0C3APW8_SERVB|nr:hypothetical protein M408DRAFT_16895 [Serendipita vermifera MAFF 305830]
MQFLIAHGRSRPASKMVDDDTGLSRDPTQFESTEHQVRGKSWLGGLIKPPVIRQFLHSGHLYKEEEERGLSHFELFADLVFVAIVRIFGEVAAEEATVSNAIKFMLMFWPPWSIWADMRSYLNVSGTDDAIQRVYILLSSVLLIGYTAQGASIHVYFPGHGAEETTTTTTTTETEDGHAKFFLFSRDLEGATISEEGYRALHAATGFFLVAKALRLLQLLLYAFALPRFRSAHLVQALFTLIPCLVFLRLFFVDSAADAMAVFVVGVLLEVVGKFLAGILVHMGATRRNQHKFFIPALEIGHVIEKTTAFFVLVSGEILMAVAYIAEDQEEIGPHGEYARSSLGVILTFLLCWVYFDADSCKVFVHAIRRHWFSSIAWTQLHLPLCASMVIVAASVHEMIQSNTIDQGLRWYFAVGMSIAMICLGIMGFLHNSLDRPGTGIIPRWVRLGLRIVLGVLFALFPLFNNDSSVLELGVYCAGLGALVIVETVGKIGTTGNVVEHHLPASKDAVNSPYFRGGAETLAEVEYSSGHKTFRRDELTAYEKGEEDVGGDESVGLMKTVVIRRGQRTGLAAF